MEKGSAAALRGAVAFGDFFAAPTRFQPTEVTPLTGFYRAENYHQDYALHHPNNPYIQVCDRPKIESLKQQFPELFIDYKGGTEAKEHR